jgi:hypothetical protein
VLLLGALGESGLQSNTIAFGIILAKLPLGKKTMEEVVAMKLIKMLTFSALFAAAVSFSAAAYAQQPSEKGGKQQDQSADRSQDRAREPEPASITGELTRVMPDQKSFTVKSTSGAEMLFRYNDQTIVSGAENNVAGLATSSGSEVTVSYKNDSAGNMASRIEVHPKR